MSQNRILKLLTAAALGASVAAPIVTAAPARAVDCEVTWVNNEGGRWDEAGNWSTGIVPTFEHDVCILPINQELSVLVDAPQAVASLQIAQGAALLLTGRANDDPAGASIAEFFSFGDIANDGGIVVDSEAPGSPGSSLTVETGATLRNRGLLFFRGTTGHALNGTVVNDLGGLVRVDGSVDNSDTSRRLNFTNFGEVEADPFGVLISRGGTVVNRGLVNGSPAVLGTIGATGVYEQRTTQHGAAEAAVNGGTLRLVDNGQVDAYLTSFAADGDVAAQIARFEGNIGPRQLLRLMASGGTGAPIVFATNTVNNGEIRFYGGGAQVVRIEASRTLTNRGFMTIDPSDATRKLRGRFVNNGVVDFAARASLGLDTNTTLGTASELVMRIATPSRYSFLTSTRGIGLNGVLEVDFDETLAPVAGQSFQLVRSPSISGRFARLDLPALPGGLRWNVVYTATRVTARIV